MYRISQIPILDYLILFGCALVGAFGLVLLVAVAADSLRYWGSESWPTAQGVVLGDGSEYGEANEPEARTGGRRGPDVDPGSSGRVGSAKPSVRYEYEVDGVVHRGSNISPQGAGDDVLRIARLSPGSTVSVSYDPSRPDRSILVPGVRIWKLLGTLALMSPIAGIGLVSLWAMLRATEPESPPHG